MFGVGCPDGSFFVGSQRMRNITTSCSEPWIELLFFHHETQELFGRLRVVGVLHDHLIEEQM